MNTTMTEITEYTRSEEERLYKDGAIAVVHDKSGRRFVITVGDEDGAECLAQPVYAPEAAREVISDFEVTDLTTGRTFCLVRLTDGPAVAWDTTDDVPQYAPPRPCGELIGHVGVDSGVVMIGDPAYGVGKSGAALMRSIAAAGHGVSSPRGGLLGLAIPTPFGDGVFPVYAHRDSDDRIVRVTVEFD